MVLASIAGEHGHEVAHDAAHAAHEGAHIPHLPNALYVLKQLGILKVDDETLGDISAIVFSLVLMLVVIGLVMLARRGMALRPTDKFYILTEMFMGGLRNFFGGVLGHAEVKKHIWLIGTLFIYILFQNLNGMVPLGYAPSANLAMNLGMAAVVFVYVLYVGISRNGFLKWFHHLLGSPDSKLMWGLSPLFLVLHILEEFIRPVSLSLRLFGNILGKEILLGVFLTLVSFEVVKNTLWVMVPLHWPFLFLALLLSVIQALIFSMLSAVYILIVLPHAEEHH